MASAYATVMNKIIMSLLLGVKNMGVMGVRATNNEKAGVKSGKGKSPQMPDIAGFCGGEDGIRTHGRLPYITFPVLHLTTTRTPLRIQFMRFPIVFTRFPVSHLTTTRTPLQIQLFTFNAISNHAPLTARSSLHEKNS